MKQLEQWRFGFEARARLIETNCNRQVPICHRVRDAERAVPRCAHVTNDAHPLADRSKHEKELVLAVLVKGHKDRPGAGLGVPDPGQRSKTMLRSHGTWIPLWRQAWEAMQKRRVKRGTEGLAANVDRVLSRIGWSWENALEVRTEEGERVHITQCPEGCWKHRIRQAARERRLRQAANRKSAKDLN